MADRATVIENLRRLRELMLLQTPLTGDVLRLAIRVADDLESRGMYSVGLESFVRSPDEADRSLILRAITTILRRLEGAAPDRTDEARA